MSAQAGCLDLGLVADTAFPAEVPGLPSGQPWVSLPVRSWLVQGDVQVRAVSACFDATCRPRAAVAVFDVAGRDAARLTADLADPSALKRELVARALLRPNVRPARSGARPAARGTSLWPPRIDVVASPGPGPPRLSVRLARPDGSRAAFGHIVALWHQGSVTFVVVIAADEDDARELAGAVAARLS